MGRLLIIMPGPQLQDEIVPNKLGCMVNLFIGHIYLGQRMVHDILETEGSKDAQLFPS